MRRDNVKYNSGRELRVAVEKDIGTLSDKNWGKVEPTFDSVYDNYDVEDIIEKLYVKNVLQPQSIEYKLADSSPPRYWINKCERISSRVAGRAERIRIAFGLHSRREIVRSETKWDSIITEWAKRAKINREWARREWINMEWTNQEWNDQEWINKEWLSIVSSSNQDWLYAEAMSAINNLDASTQKSVNAIWENTTRQEGPMCFEVITAIRDNFLLNDGDIPDSMQRFVILANEINRLSEQTFWDRNQILDFLFSDKRPTMPQFTISSTYAIASGDERITINVNDPHLSPEIVKKIYKNARDTLIGDNKRTRDIAETTHTLVRFVEGNRVEGWTEMFRKWNVAYKEERFPKIGTMKATYYRAANRGVGEDSTNHGWHKTKLVVFVQNNQKKTWLEKKREWNSINSDYPFKTARAMEVEYEKVLALAKAGFKSMKAV